jgi:hypothetical protein
MFSRFVVQHIACAMLVSFFVIGCEDTPFNSSTIGSSEGDGCNPQEQGQCGAGLECYVPPNCSQAVCCPPQDPANPVCYCAAGDDGAEDSGDASASPEATVFAVPVTD